MLGALGDLVQFFLAHHVDGRFHQIAHHGFHVATHVADLRVFGGFHFDEGATGQARQAPRNFRFSNSGGPDHQNIFGQNIFGHFRREFLAAHAIAQRHGYRAFCGGLPDNVFVQLDDNFARCELVKRGLGRGFRFVLLAGKIDHHNLNSAFTGTLREQIHIFVIPSEAKNLSFFSRPQIEERFFASLRMTGMKLLEHLIAVLLKLHFRAPQT